MRVHFEQSMLLQKHPLLEYMFSLPLSTSTLDMFTILSHIRIMKSIDDEILLLENVDLVGFANYENDGSESLFTIK